MDVEDIKEMFGIVRMRRSGVAHGLWLVELKTGEWFYF
jgi:hypothetical protein